MSDFITVSVQGTSVQVIGAGNRGIQGATGAQGVQGVQGSTGVQGSQGVQGLQGVQGTQGLQGNQGVQGLTGIQGLLGNQGTQGVQGQIGIQGAQGLLGIQGQIGIQGQQGSQGTVGMQGANGTQGFVGTQGAVGAQGAQGLQGLQGYYGNQGTVGLQGLQGNQGVIGLQGLTGIQGAVGTQGLQGLQGSQGVQGLQGVQGIVGPIASNNAHASARVASTADLNATYTAGSADAGGGYGIGAKLTHNTNGAISIDGVSLSLNDRVLVKNQTNAIYNGIYTVTTVGSIVAPYVLTRATDYNNSTAGQVEYGDYLYIVAGSTQSGQNFIQYNVGTGTNGYIIIGTDQILFAQTSGSGPQGTQGPAGAQGIQGVQGSFGIQGSVGTQGSVGSQGSNGAQGTSGTNGVQGYVGAQGMAGTNGAQGAIGATGVQGSVGMQGSQGTTGNTGSQGTIGLQGNTGSTGIQGATGTQGATGSQGANGTQGFSGSQGTAGSNGSQGTQGLQGLQGLTGLQGASGTNGSNGSQGTTGATGSQGATGSTGSQGTTGTTGLQGVQGIQGLVGTQGIQGITPTIALNQWRKAASGGETSLSGTDDFSTSLSYTVGAEQVFINGVLLERGVDYTASTGTSITSLTALIAGDIATVVSPTSFTVANAIQSTQIAAKGDLIVGTGSGTYTNQGVGADGTTLVANSSASTGVSWSAGNAVPNPVINSCMDIWQRFTSSAITSSSSSFYGPDRWQVYRGASGSTISRQATNDTTNLPNIQYCARVQRDSGNTSTSNINFIQNFESVNSIPFAGKAVTLSFYARAGSNYSATSNALLVWLNSGTGTDQNFVVSYTGLSYVVSGTATLTTAWQRFTFSGTVPTTATELAIQIQSNPTGTAGTNDYFEITGVQIDLGSVALPVRRNGSTLQGELAACQRYYYQLGGVANGFPIVGGYLNATGNQIRFPISFPTNMRIAPAITVVGTWNTSGNTTQPNPVFINSQGFSIEISSSSGQVPAAYAYPDTSGKYMTINAEL